MLGQEPEAIGAFQARVPDGIGNAVEVGRSVGVRQLDQGIEGQQSMDQEIEQQMACAIGEGSYPLPDGGDIRSRMGQSFHQPLPTQTRDQVEENNTLEQTNRIVAMGMQKVGQQAVGASADFAPHPLDQDAVVHNAGAGPALVGAPADQAAVGLTVEMRAGVRDSKVVTGEGDGFGVLLHRTGKVLYNDHELGTPPSSWFGPANLETRWEVSSFLAWIGAFNKRRATCWRRAIIPVSTSPVKLGCAYAPLLPPSCRSLNVSAHPEAATGSEGRSILFGRDWPYFDQRKWPITPEHRHLFQLIVSALLFVGGAWALSRAIILVTTSEPSSISQIDWITLLSPAVFLTLLGFILVAAAIGVSRYPIIRRSLAGISQIQQELASGFGETRPLVQVVQETINNARQTFVVQLRLSQAMFWAGLLFIAVAFYRVLIMGETNWVTTSVTGGAGLFSWIFSYFIAQRGNIQANLADVTQLELGLVGLAKQVTAIDRWLATFLIEPYSLDTKELKESERSTGWALQVIQQGTYAAASLVELYAQVAQGEDEEVKERRKLLNEAVRIHSGLDSDTTRTAN
jgi:hypothetical protein